MRIQTRVVVNVDAGQWAVFQDPVVDVSEQLGIFTVHSITAGPAAIEIGLLIQVSQAMFGSLDIADQD